MPETTRFRVNNVESAIDFRVSIMPSIHGEDASHVLDKESMSEKFRTLTLDVVGFDEDDLRKFRRYIKEPYGSGAGHGNDGQRRMTTLYAAGTDWRRRQDQQLT